MSKPVRKDGTVLAVQYADHPTRATASALGSASRRTNRPPVTFRRRSSPDTPIRPRRRLERNTPSRNRRSSCTRVCTKKRRSSRSSYTIDQCNNAACRHTVHRRPRTGRRSNPRKSHRGRSHRGHNSSSNSRYPSCTACDNRHRRSSRTRRTRGRCNKTAPVGCTNRRRRSTAPADIARHRRRAFVRRPRRRRNRANHSRIASHRSARIASRPLAAPVAYNEPASRLEHDKRAAAPAMNASRRRIALGKCIDASSGKGARTHPMWAHLSESNRGPPDLG